MNIQQQAQELAQAMGVSAHDVLAMAQSMANSIKQDKAADAFLAAGDDDRRAFTEAYASHAVKKLESFHSVYMSRPEAREVFQRKVLEGLN